MPCFSATNTIWFICVELQIVARVEEAGDLQVDYIMQDVLKSVQTQGLLGTIDGNPENDFLTPTGDLVPYDSNEEVVYKQFGQLCELAFLILTSLTLIYIAFMQVHIL